MTYRAKKKTVTRSPQEKRVNNFQVPGGKERGGGKVRRGKRLPFLAMKRGGKVALLKKKKAGQRACGCQNHLAGKKEKKNQLQIEGKKKRVFPAPKIAPAGPDEGGKGESTFSTAKRGKKEKGNPSL